ncbi:hypothetical protein Tsubulata_047278 [Turnera subulata]|uniref:RNase H type-1 domain-containing protein n=1 Tax=Turnera subulata TaxID=218843 RepID=A0A9Q0GEL7_9ROSI|nr:hypothetical protein Tsubulata_047278 [Turnera subulata]
MYTLCQDPAQYSYFSRRHLSHDAWNKMNTLFLESKVLEPLRFKITSPRSPSHHVSRVAELIDPISRNGVYSVKSGYNLIVSSKNNSTGALPSSSSSVSEDPVKLAIQASEACDEYMAQQKSVFSRAVSVHCRPDSVWKAPPQGWVKLNCDAAYDKSTGKASGGVLVRDAAGRVLGKCFILVCPGMN